MQKTAFCVAVDGLLEGERPPFGKRSGPGPCPSGFITHCHAPHLTVLYVSIRRLAKHG